MTIMFAIIQLLMLYNIFMLEVNNMKRIFLFAQGLFIYSMGDLLVGLKTMDVYLPSESQVIP